ncbi:DUF4349 domain-containing protein [Altererythrobacter salegens]|uniref:DUF4349 domain-containing protein n=1 Tax=Croceibacterium salegens TaxID=1737568 RepID=A0A6I4T226_9SPHN|nr:DUF4349 domain-containing protein [Croceibacterium salegens]MXO61386.1 DUF4349 domain-containing protein [Croceibacterium salegens]
MTSRNMCVAAAALAITGCGGSAYKAATADRSAPQAQFGFREALETSSILPDLPAPPEERVASAEYMVDEPDPDVRPPMPAGMPQIAYRYDYGFRVDPEKLVAVEQQHSDLCTKRGAQVCRLISMEHFGATGDYARGELRMEVRADLVQEFGKALSRSAESAGGELFSSSVSGEDLSKDIVDTEARLRARTLLRDRLMEVLRSRKGSVADLIKAERGVTDVNEEIDQAQSWLAEMKGRVAFSKITVDYSSASPSGGGFWEPIRWAFGSMGTTLGRTIATLLLFVTALLPWLLLLAALVWAWRRSGLRLWPLRRKRPASFAEGNGQVDAAG